ncbi:MAG: MarR family transcriptional regulator [Candidatus Thorarchaeota archaeon]|nr:MarR family transcriptional regulator [Candidatus Thorarchaeota archaeon]
MGLPNSAILVLNSLAAEGPMTPKTIIEKVGLAPRTISFALRTLVREQVIRKTPNLSDMRQPIYHVDMERVKELQLRFDSGRISQIPSSFRPSGHSFNR